MPTPKFPEGKLTEISSEIKLAVHEQGRGPAVVFCHGFPELAYSWRYQLPAVAAAGFRAIAPDQRGYAESSAPQEINAYGLGELTGDLVGLLDKLGIDRAIFVGHDWGGLVAWAMPVLHPQRVAGVIGICTPYMPMPVTDVMRTMVGGEDDRHYILWFQKPGQAEAVMDKKVRLIFSRLMRRPLDPREMAKRMMAEGKFDFNPFRRIDEFTADSPAMVTPEELDVYVRAFEKTGFRGGINWYRNIDRNARQFPQVGQTKLNIPCLMITAEWDVALPPHLAAGMSATCSDLETKNIERAGHWVQQEFPDAINQVMVDWLERRFAK